MVPEGAKEGLLSHRLSRSRWFPTSSSRPVDSESTRLCIILMFGTNSANMHKQQRRGESLGAFGRLHQAQRGHVDHGWMKVYICPSSCLQGWEGQGVGVGVRVGSTSHHLPHRPYTHIPDSHPCEDACWYNTLLTLMLVFTRAPDPSLFPVRKAEVLETRLRSGNPGPVVLFQPDGVNVLLS